MKSDDKKPVDQQESEPSGLDNELAQLHDEAAPDQAVIDQKTAVTAAVDQKSESLKEYKQLIEMVLKPLPALIAPNWAIKPEEIDALTNAYAAACVEQWPEGVGELGPWAGAALVTVAVIGPRAGTPLRPPKQKEPVKPVHNGGNNGSP